MRERIRRIESAVYKQRQTVVKLPDDGAVILPSLLYIQKEFKVQIAIGCITFTSCDIGLLHYE